MGGHTIVVLGTGGTIAGQADAPHDHTGYTAAQLGVAQLLHAVPGVARAAGGAELHVRQLAQVDSKDMDFALWRTLAVACSQALQDTAVRGVVITHGTDTLEETAWFLHQVLAARKPVVLTAAMRPATALSPDGPQNLCDAVTVAASPTAQGVWAVLEGTVHGALALRKSHPYRTDAFTSDDAGPCGWVEQGQLRWQSNGPPRYDSKPFAAIENIANATVWPWVEIVHSHAGARPDAVDALCAAGVQGLVVAATGNGTVHHALLAALLRAQQAGVAVRRASRCTRGVMVAPADNGLPLAPAGLSPWKARISLMLELLKTP